MKRILHFILMPALILALLLPGTAAAAVKPEVDPEDPDRIFVGGWKAGYGDLTVDLTEATGGRVRAEDFLDVTLPEPDYPWSGAPETSATRAHRVRAARNFAMVLNWSSVAE